MLNTFMELRREYIRLLSYLTPNVPETILDDFWYTYKIYPPRWKDDYIFKCVHYGLIYTDIEVELCHYVGGVGPNFFHIWIGPRLSEDEKRKGKIALGVMTACTEWDFDRYSLEEVIATSHINKFFAAIRAEHNIT